MAFPRGKTSAIETDQVTSLSTSTGTGDVSQSRNPWNRENQFIKNSQETLVLATQMNIMDPLPNQANLANELAELPSSKLISLQREITEKKKQIIKLKQDIATYHLQNRYGNILNLDSIAKRINMIKQMCNDLDSVLRNKEKLITRLQTPFVGDFIKVEADYHKYVHEVLSDLVSCIINISPYLDNISWLAYRDISATTTEPLVIEIQSLMASLQTFYQMLSQKKTGIEEMERNYELRRKHIKK